MAWLIKASLNGRDGTASSHFIWAIVLEAAIQQGWARKHLENVIISGKEVKGTIAKSALASCAN